MKRIVVLAVLVALGSASVGSSFAVTVTPTDHLTTLTKDQLTELYYAMLSYYTPDTAMKAVGQVIAIDPRTFEDDGRVKIEDSLEVVIKESKPGEIQPL
ncbi:MAG: hypothetical protein HYY16_01000, partial [Planctomycetes bacterium]|nr:hypothetical protein [Planctomycetota bacterium]